MRKILGVFSSPRPHWVGDGFPVSSVFSHYSHGEHVSPFILLDYAAPTQFTPAAQPRGVGAHPHRGFETVTIVYDGEIEHKDSAGGGGLIGPGDVQWMTAGAGIIHEEFHSEAFTRQGGTFEVFQLWVNLPARDKSAPPAYQTLLKGEIPVVRLGEDMGQLRVIAGDYNGTPGPARTFTPINVLDVTLRAEGVADFPVEEGHTAMVIVRRGTVEANGEAIARAGEMVLFDRSAGKIRIEANNDSAFLVLSGEPLNEPVVAHGPFVMNTAEEIEAAVADYMSGRFGGIPVSQNS